KLLESFVRDQEAGLSSMPSEMEAVDVRRTVVVAERHAAQRTMIREVLGRRRIEVTIGSRGGRAAADGTPAPAVPTTEAAAERPETAAANIGGSVQTTSNISRGCHFNNAAKLSAVFRREISGENMYCLQLAVLKIRRERGRSV